VKGPDPEEYVKPIVNFDAETQNEIKALIEVYQDLVLAINN